MPIKLKVYDPDADQDALAELTQELCNQAAQVDGVRAELAKSETVKGGKGDPITLGVIALTFLTSGAAVALFKVVESYAKRKKTFEFEFDDGTTKLKLSSENLSGEERDRTLSKLERMTGTKK
jgi:hypothetical protein